MVAGHDHERVVGEAALAQAVEDPPDLRVDAAQRVEVAAEVVVVGRQRAALEEVDPLVGRAGFVGMVALHRPGDRVEGLAGRLDPGSGTGRRRRAGRRRPTTRAADPGRARCTSQITSKPRFCRKRFCAGVVEVARVDEAGAIAARLQHVGQRRAGEVRILDRVLPPRHVGEDRQADGGERVRGHADVAVEVVEDESRLRLGRELAASWDSGCRRRSGSAPPSTRGRSAARSSASRPTRG